MRNAATPWAPPTAKQIGIVSALWCKGWIIENDEISDSKCFGVALGKYGDEFDNRAGSAEGYVGTLNRSLTNGWNKATVGSLLPCFAAGNVFTRGSKPSKFDVDALLKPEFDACVKITEKADGWYLTIAQDKGWRNEVERKLVTTELLGKAKVPDCAFENPDGTPLKVNADFFGKPRNAANPTPGPFENPGDGKLTLKVW